MPLTLTEAQYAALLASKPPKPEAAAFTTEADWPEPAPAPNWLLVACAPVWFGVVCVAFAVACSSHSLIMALPLGVQMIATARWFRRKINHK